MVCVFDIGNSYTKLVVFDKYNNILDNKRFPTIDLPINEISNFIISKKVETIIVGSVVLGKEKKIVQISKSLNIKYIILSNQNFWNKGFNCNCSKEDIGIDILGLSYYLSTFNKEFICISFGTLTFASLYYDNSLQGVTIAPNLHLNDFAFFTKVSLINDVKVDINNHIKFGKDTNSAISTGIAHYYKGFINSLYDAASEIIKVEKIYITGGNSNILNKIKLNYKIIIDEHLVAKGYNLVSR